ncbi:MAG: hypothetical protein VKJ04_11560 [Vampirovibrionales bacterium]|nr:hypothetical protein [Vampirovibrionales bacterium]
MKNPSQNSQYADLRSEVKKVATAALRKAAKAAKTAKEKPSNPKKITTVQEHWDFLDPN